MASQAASSIEVSASPERVWALISNVNRYPDLFFPVDRMVEVPEGSMAVGYSYREFGGIPPFKSDSEWQVTVFEPYRRQVHVGDDGKMTIEITFDLEATPAGTRLAHAATLTPRWFTAPLNIVLWPLLM